MQADDSAACLWRASFSLTILSSLLDIWLDISQHTASTETSNSCRTILELHVYMITCVDAQFDVPGPISTHVFVPARES